MIEGIRMSLGCLKGLGRSTAEAIVTYRDKPYTDLVDLCTRCPAGTINAKVITALVDSGSLDPMGYHRSQWHAIAARAMKDGKQQAKHTSTGQTSFMDLFDDEPDGLDMPRIPETPERERLIREKAVLGFYMSGHPLSEYRGLLDELCTGVIRDVDRMEHRTEVILGGMVSSVAVKYMNRGGTNVPRGQITFEDYTGEVSVVAWPESWYEYGRLLTEDAIGFLVGTVDSRREPVQIVLQHWITVQDAGLLARCCLLRHDSDLEAIHEAVMAHPGDRQLYLEPSITEGERVVYRVAEKVSLDHAFMAKVQGLGKPRLIGNQSRATGPQPQVKPWVWTE